MKPHDKGVSGESLRHLGPLGIQGSDPWLANSSGSTAGQRPTVVPSDTIALMAIEEWPQDLESSLFHTYPAMKLGHIPSANAYGDQLAVVAARICREATTPVVVTTPPVYRLPAGANLLARAVYRRMVGQGFDVTLFEPLNTRHATGFSNGGHQRLDKDYCKTGLEERVAARARQHRALDTTGMQEIYEGRTLIIVNDIHVSGTQQRFMYQTCCAFRAHTCHWLYVFKVSPVLGRNHPGLESDITHSRLQDPETFTGLLADPEMDHTLRCLERLLHAPEDTFRAITANLSVPLRRHLHALARLEGCFDSALFENKMTMLARE